MVRGEHQASDFELIVKLKSNSPDADARPVDLALNTRGTYLKGRL
jgi:hypothetical protein